MEADGEQVGEKRPASEFANDCICAYWSFLLQSEEYKKLGLEYNDILATVWDVRHQRKEKPEQFLEEIRRFIKVLQFAEKEVENELQN